jgi:hypothetical protein
LIGVFVPPMKLVVKYLYYKFNNDRDLTAESENVEDGRDQDVDSKEKSSVLLFVRKRSHYMILNRFKYIPSPQSGVLPLFSVDRFVCQINSYLAFMFCFGLLLPPLGIMAGISIVLIINFEYLTLGS